MKKSCFLKSFNNVSQSFNTVPPHETIIHTSVCHLSLGKHNSHPTWRGVDIAADGIHLCIHLIYVEKSLIQSQLLFGKCEAIHAKKTIVLTLALSQRRVFKSRPTLWLYVDGRDSADKSSCMHNHINEDVIIVRVCVCAGLRQCNCINNCFQGARENERW